MQREKEENVKFKNNNLRIEKEEKKEVKYLCAYKIDVIKLNV